MKKIIALFLTFVLILSLSSVVFADPGDASLVCTASNDNLMPGDIFTITVSLQDASNAQSVALVFDYDVTDTFTLIDGEWLLSGAFITNFDRNTTACGTAAIAYQQATNVNGNIFTLTLQVNDNPTIGDKIISVSAVVKIGSTPIPCDSGDITVYVGAQVTDDPIIIGAQYRTLGETGIRFCTEIFSTNKNGNYTVNANDEATFSNVEAYGTLIIPLNLIDDPTDLVLTANGKITSAARPAGVEYLNITGQKIYRQFDDRIQFTAVIIGIPDAAPGGANYDRDFVAVSYIKYKTGEIVYSDPCVRSIEMLVNASV